MPSILKIFLIFVQDFLSFSKKNSRQIVFLSNSEIGVHGFDTFFPTKLVKILSPRTDKEYCLAFRIYPRLLSSYYLPNFLFSTCIVYQSYGAPKIELGVMGPLFFLARVVIFFYIINHISPLTTYVNRIWENEADVVGTIISEDFNAGISLMIKEYLKDNQFIGKLKPFIEENLELIEEIEKNKGFSFTDFFYDMTSGHPSLYNRIQTLLDLKRQFITNTKTEETLTYEKYSKVPKFTELKMKASEYLLTNTGSNLKEAMGILFAVVIFAWVLST